MEDAMNAAAVRTMTADDEARAVATIVVAFAADPMTRWTWPDAHQYLAAFPRMVRAFGGKAFGLGSAYVVGDYAGAALWLPPGTAPDEEALGAVMQDTLSPERLEQGPAIFEQMATYHPHEPHWYLPLIGVDPAYQGNGHGDVLMRFALERCDRDGVAAYLESSNPRNISLYRRHGFEPIGTIQADSSPPIVPMLRKAR
jgi:ribosomal protein S18 acetylase RimI-like enzyme